YTRACGDGPNHGQSEGRHLKFQREDVSALDRFSVHRCPPTAGL
ncbi:hypothetical protein TNCV_5018251, partial [Trichonephila clavipes]